MTDDETPWFVEQRALHLAMLHLTRNPHVRLEQEVTFGRAKVDLLVTLGDGAQLAIEALGVMSGDREPGAPPANVVAAKTDQLQALARATPLPMGLLVYDVQTDDGWFGWVAEPMRDADGLHAVESIGFEPFTDVRREQILDEVSAWYARRRAA